MAVLLASGCRFTASKVRKDTSPRQIPQIEDLLSSPVDCESSSLRMPFPTLWSVRNVVSDHPRSTLLHNLARSAQNSAVVCQPHVVLGATTPLQGTRNCHIFLREGSLSLLGVALNCSVYLKRIKGQCRLNHHEQSKLRIRII